MYRWHDPAKRYGTIQTPKSLPIAFCAMSIAHCNPLGAPSIRPIWHIWVTKKTNTHPHLQSTTNGLPRMRTHPKTYQQCPETFLFDVSSPITYLSGLCPRFLIENKGVTNSRIPKILRTLTPICSPTFYILLGLGRSVCRAPHEHAFGSEEL